MLASFFLAWGTARVAGAAFLGLIGLGAASADAAAAEASLFHLRCTNPANGANWLVLVDPEHRLVDSLPATISDTTITWRNTKGGTYRFERATGTLQLSAPSTTGGYFLYYTCKPE